MLIHSIYDSLCAYVVWIWDDVIDQSYFGTKSRQEQVRSNVEVKGRLAGWGLKESLLVAPPHHEHHRMTE